MKTLIRLSLILSAVSLVLPVALYAAQFDAPYYALEKRNAEAWANQDKQIDKKLATLEKKFGKKPNIIYILTDDIGWGELGWQGGGKHRGTPTPTLDRMAREGMRFWSAYAEPSCTPTRIAINTGRHPVHTGLLTVLWPGQPEGLSPNEITVAELLSDAGYHTAMWGKWHLGDESEHAPTNQGYDYAYYGLFNGAPDAWQDSRNLYDVPTPASAPFMDFPGYEEYAARTGIDLSIAGYYGEKGKDRKPIEGPAGKLGIHRQEVFENETNDQMLDWIDDKSKTDKPFFIYWASYALQITGSKEHQNDPGVDKPNAQASMMVLHNEHVDNLLKKLERLGIAENTLVVWYSDNGPMYASGPQPGILYCEGPRVRFSRGVYGFPQWPGGQG